MKIVVCLKQVPGTTEIKIDSETNNIIRQGIKNIVNPFDTYAVEEGVRLKERHGGEVIALTMGPPQAVDALREAISVGADRAVLLSDPGFAGADTWATAYTLAQAIGRMAPYDLIVCGRQTIDGDTGQVGPELAEMLGLPFIAYVSRVEEIAGGRLRVRRMVEEGYEIMDAPLPAVITVSKEINVPRLPSLRGISKARSAVIPAWDAAAIGAEAAKTGLQGSATRVTRIFFPQWVVQGEILEGEPETQVAELIGRLRESGVL